MSLSAEDLRQLAEAAEADSHFREDDTLGNLLKALKEKRDHRDSLRAQEKEATAEYEALNKQLAQMFEARGIQNHKIKGVGTFYTTTKSYASVKDMDRFIEWLDEHGEGAIATRQVHHARAQSFYNERLERGEEVPPEDVVTAFTKTTIAIRKA